MLPIISYNNQLPHVPANASCVHPKVSGNSKPFNHGARLKTSLHLFQSTASDASSSWEAVDEKESKPTLWVPDHAAQTCASCHTAFWFGRRKHHCRNCGGVFCRSGHLLNSYYVQLFKVDTVFSSARKGPIKSPLKGSLLFQKRQRLNRMTRHGLYSECSDNLAPIPMEQLYHPVRICNSCYRVIHGPDTGTRQQLAPDNSPSQCQVNKYNFPFFQKMWISSEIFRRQL